MVKGRKTLSDAVMQRFMTDPSSIQADQIPTEVALSAIKLPQKRQPRRYFDPEKLEQLITSVREHGILEPLLVRPSVDGSYELVAGERRLRAAREVGLTHVPIVSRNFSDQEALQVALIENLQRDDLNPLEETEAVLELLALALDVSVEEVKSIIYQGANAKNRRTELKENVSLQLEKLEGYLAELGRFNLESLRSSRLPLLNLPSDVLNVLREGKIEYTKARAIARVKDEYQRKQLLQQVLAQNLSLSEIKKQIKALRSPEALEEFTQKELADRVTELSKRLKQGKLPTEQKMLSRIAKLLDELEKLTAES